MRHLAEWRERLRRRRASDMFRCALARTGLRCLRLLFRFDAWHVNGSYACRSYKKAVVELVNALRPAVAVEVGCGLGDIVSRIEAAERIGIDIDENAIRAARFLHRRDRWVRGDSSCVLDLQPLRIDCLIMVNWIHRLSPDELAGLLLPLLPRTRYLILDAIDPDAPRTYRYKHDFAFLGPFTRRLRTARVPEEPRSFLVLEVNP